MSQERFPAFEGSPVHESRVKFTKAEDALRETFELDNELAFIVHGYVKRVEYRDKDGKVTRWHTVEVSDLARIGHGPASELVAKYREQRAAEFDASVGQERIPAGV